MVIGSSKLIILICIPWWSSYRLHKVQGLPFLFLSFIYRRTSLLSTLGKPVKMSRASAFTALQNTNILKTSNLIYLGWICYKGYYANNMHTYRHACIHAYKTGVRFASFYSRPSCSEFLCGAHGIKRLKLGYPSKKYGQLLKFVVRDCFMGQQQYNLGKQIQYFVYRQSHKHFVAIHYAEINIVTGYTMKTPILYWMTYTYWSYRVQISMYSFWNINTKFKLMIQT